MTALRYSFSYLEPVCCSMSSSNCCFLTCIQISQEAGQVAWYSYLFQNFQFIVIHTVKRFGVVTKAEVDVFWNSLAFSMIQWTLAIWSLVPLPFLNPAWTSGCSQFMYCWSLAWRILSITLLACQETQEMQVWSLDKEDPMEMEMATHCRFPSMGNPMNRDSGCDRIPVELF